MALSLTALVLGYGLTFQPVQATAAAANTVNFQARLETASGSIALDGNYNVRFKLYSGSTGGTAAWTESYLVSGSNSIRTANGYLTANLGSATAFPSSLNWGQQLYLTMEIGGTGSSPSWDGEMSPRLPLTSVPSAFALNSYNSALGYTSSLTVAQPTGGNQTFSVPDQGAAGSYALLTTTAANTSFIQNQNASAQATSNFWISGTGKAATSLQAPLLDAPSASSLQIGTTNATSITIGSNGINTIVAGPLSVSGTITGNGGLNVAGATSINSSGTASTTLGNSSAVLTIAGQGATAATTVYGTRVAGDTNDRITIGADGKISFGTGSLAPDASLYRSGVGVVSLGSAFGINTSRIGSAQLSVQASSANNPAQINKAFASQTADLLQLQDSSGNALSGFNATGQLYFQSGTYANRFVQATLGQNQALTIPASTGSSDTLCLLNLNNCGGSGAASAIGALDGGSANVNGASIIGSTFYLQSASASYAGVVNTATQTLAGAKTFSGALSANSTLSVTGATTLTGLLTANGGLTVAGTTNINTTGTTTTTIGNSGAPLSINGNGASATSLILAVRVAGNTYDRFNVQASGQLNWGSGTAAATDVNLYRSSTTLATDNSFTALGSISAGSAITGSKLSVSIGSASQIGVSIRLSNNVTSTGDLLQFQNYAAAVLGGVNPSGQLYYQSGSYKSTLAQSALSQNQTITIPATNASGGADNICLQALANCASNGANTTSTGTANYVARFTGANTLGVGLLYDSGTYAGAGISSQLNNSTFGVQAASGTIALTAKGVAGQDIADFTNASGVQSVRIDQNGVINGNAGAAFSSSFGSSNNLTTNTVTNTNSTGTASVVNASSIGLTGATNTNANANILNGINLQNVTAVTNNAFNGIYAGTGYTSLLNYNGTSLISGAGKLQNAALDSTLNYSNLQNVTNLTAIGALAGNSLSVGTGGITDSGVLTVSGTGASSVAGSLAVAGQLSSLSYLLGSDLSIVPIAGSQSAISSWWGLQLVGNRQNSVNYTPTAIGSAGAYGVLIPSQQAGSVALLIQGASGQSGDLMQLQNSGGTVLAKVSSTGALTAVGINSGTGLIQGTGGETTTGAIQLNASGSGTTTIGSSAAGAVTLQSAGAINLTAGAASTISTGGNSLSVTASNFNVSSSGSLSVGTSSVAGSLALTNGNGTNSTIASSATAAQTYTLPATGGTLCTTTSCATAGTGYISNTTTQQIGANFNIQSSTGQVAAKIQGAASQDIIDFYGSGSSSTVLAKIASDGSLTAVNANFTGAVSAVGINSGTGLIQGSGGLTVSGTTTLSSLTAGSVPFIATGGVVSQNNAKFFYDNTNNRLGIGTNSPTSTLTVANAGQAGIQLLTTTANAELDLTFTNNAGSTLTGLAGSNGNILDNSVANDYVFNNRAGAGILFSADTAHARRDLYIASNGAVSLGATGTTTTNGGSLTVGGNLSFGQASTIASTSGQLSIGSASGTLGITSTTTTLQRTAASDFTIDLNDSGNRTLILKNSGTGVANLNLFGGVLSTGATPVTRIDNSGNFFSNTETISPTIDGANIFQVQNAADANLIAIDTTATNQSNNGAAESATFTAWTQYGTATITRDTTVFVAGAASAKAVTGAANSGVKNTLVSTLANGQTYLASFSARSGTAGDVLSAAYLYNGTAADTGSTNCTTGQTMSNTAFLKFNCYFTVGSTPTAANAFAIYNATSGKTFYVDNLSINQQTASILSVNQVRIGGYAGQGLTVLTLDTAAAAPTSATNTTALLGSMYYDTTAGAIQCYGSSGWGACGVSPNIGVNLIPEYSGAVLDGTKWGSNKIGTMTSGLCSGTSRLSVNTSLCGATDDYNYYAWTSPQATSQTYSVYVRYQLPATFKSFTSSAYPTLSGYSTNVSSSAAGSAQYGGVQFSMFDVNGNNCGATGSRGTGVTAVTSTANSWQTGTLNPTSSGSCAFAANDVVTFRIDVTSISNSNAYVSNLSFLTIGK